VHDNERWTKPLRGAAEALEPFAIRIAPTLLAYADQLKSQEVRDLCREGRGGDPAPQSDSGPRRPPSVHQGRR